MPKSQYVDPGKAFEAGFIHFEDIPVCQYKKTLAEEKKIYTIYLRKLASRNIQFSITDQGKTNILMRIML